ncbi:NACHT domain-containing protein [Amycolatopsis sp. NPDC004625]|uniref:NACHT domain-containing protein n=1 Tax=Amycolatopsis sp. NPDC004625 TaxID=3154670 RepID=UPI0033BD1675
MTEYRNEIKDGTFSAPVVQAGSIGRLNIHVGAETPLPPPLTSWDDRPELTPQLRDVLAAQQSATESLPYKLLGVRQPELTKVYVQQTMRAQATDRLGESERWPGDPDRRTGDVPGERTLTMTEALNRGGHLMITGEPGAGKSTVGYMYVQQISEYWLGGDEGQPPVAEPVLPLRVPARALAENAAWGELLASGLEAVLGRMLDEKPRPELLARRALGARWLVFVDGLDEIVEPQARAHVIAALAHRIRRSTDHRLVITTRPLPHNELVPLERAGIDTVEIQPFSPGELEDFARAWFRAQNPLTAAKGAAEFVRQVRDSRLRELVRNPLQATIAAITHTLEPGRPLPNSRIDLYDRFMAYLLDEKASRRDTFAELRRGAHDDPQRLALLDWLRQHRAEIVEHLAVHRLESESSLIDAARDWITGRHAEVAHGWPEDLRAILAGTGVFVSSEDDLRFRHHSFAEFLAARSRAGEIPAEFPDLEEWIERGLSGAKRVFALFTFVLWGRENNDVGRILRKLLEGTGDRVLLAGRLISEGIDVDEDLTAAVVNRLFDLLVCQGARKDPWDDLESVGEVLRLFMPQTLGPVALDRLRALRDHPDLAEATRIEAAAVLGRLTDAEGVASWLEEFLQLATLSGVKRGAEVLQDLVADGAERVENLMILLAATTEHDLVRTMALISVLLDADRTASAAKMVRGLVGKLRLGPAVQGDPFGYGDGDSRLADSWEDGAANWGVLAELAGRAGCRAEALWAARRAFASTYLSSREFRDAVDAVLEVGGPDAVTEVVAATAGRPTSHLVQAAFALQAKLHSADALELARQVLANPNAGELVVSRAARIFTACDATDVLLEQVESLPHFGALRLVKIASSLPEEKQFPTVRESARLALVDGAVDQWIFSSACRILLSGGAQDQTAARAVYEASLDRGPDFWAEAAVALCASGHDELGEDLITKVRSEGEVDAWVDVAADLVEKEQPDQAMDLLTAAAAAISDCSEYRQWRLIKAMSECGRKDESIDAAKRAVVEGLDGFWLGECVEVWIQAGGAAAAEGILAELSARDVRADQRMKVADQFAEAGLPAPAVEAWLNVLRYHGDAVDQGVLAASCLVKCGYRAEAAALLTESLGDRRLPAATRERLRSLHAWVTTGPETDKSR